MSNVDITGPHRSEMPHLSPRETQIMILTGEGLTMDEIAMRLSVSYSLVKHLTDAIRWKTGVKKRRQLIPLAKLYEWPEKTGRVAD